MKYISLSIAMVFSLSACTASYTDVNNPEDPIRLGPNAIGNKGTSLDLLGERPQSCQKKKDQTVLVFPDSHRKEINELIANNNFKSFTFKNSQECVRVGTEVSMEFETGPNKYLGLSFVTRMELNPHSHSIYFDVISPVYSLHLTQTDKRLPSCGSRGDWTRHYIGTENVETKVEKLINDSSGAEITNGALNCYRIGKNSSVRMDRNDREDRGEITTRELYLIHMSELTQAHADLVHMSLADLITKLAPEKERDGGYVNILVFDYTPAEVVPE